MTDYKHLFQYDDPIVKRSLSSRGAAYANGDFITIVTTSDVGLLVADHLAPEHIFAPDVSDMELGQALLSALSLSRLIEFNDPAYTNEAQEESYQAWIKEKMARFGYKTKTSLFKDMDSCGIVIKDGFLIISPSYHDRLEGWSEKFIDEKDYVRVPADSSPEAVGAALRLAFSRCKTKGFGSVRLKTKPKKTDAS